MKSIIIFTIILLSLNSFSQNIFTVTKTTDPDPFVYPYNFVDSLCDPVMYGTFQWAIRKANDATGTTTIFFNIAGSGVQEIILNYELPQIQNKQYITIDGTTQTGYQYKEPTIVINGNQLRYTCLSFYNSSNITIKGLYIKNFLINGISFLLVDNSTITENVINQIDNGYLLKEDCYGIKMYGSSNNDITRNLIGTDVNNTPLGNMSYGIELNYYASGKLLKASTGNKIGNNLIPSGQPEDYYSNTIAYNGNAGIWVAGKGERNLITRNKIYENPVGIVLLDGGNIEKQAPVITQYDITINTLKGTAKANDIVEIFGSTGAENANEYLTTVTANVNGDWTVNISTTYDYFIATATDASDNTSALSVIKSNQPSGCSFDITETAFILNTNTPVNVLSTCTQYTLTYDITYFNLPQILPFHNDFVIHLPLGFTYIGLDQNSLHVTVNNPDPSNPEFHVTWWGALDPPIFSIIVETAPCIPQAQLDFTSIEATNCQTTPVSSNTSFIIVAPTLEVFDANTGPQIVSTGIMNEFVYDIFNSSLNGADISQINVSAVLDPSIILQGKYYITTTPSPQPPENAYDYISNILPTLNPFTFTNGASIPLIPALAPQQHYYLHIPYFIDPTFAPSPCGDFSAEFTFSVGCNSNVVCPPTTTLTSSMTVIGGIPDLTVETVPPSNLATYCPVAPGTSNQMDIDFNIRNTGADLGQLFSSGKATNIHLYVYCDNTIGQITQFLINNIPITTLPTSTPSGDFIIYDLDFEHDVILNYFGDWKPWGTNTLADWDHDGFIDDLLVGDEFVLTVKYNYFTDCPTGLHTDECFTDANIVSVFAYHNNQCLTMDSPLSPVTDVLTFPPDAAFTYSASAAYSPEIEFFDDQAPFNQITTIDIPTYSSFNAVVYPGVLNEQWSPEGFGFDCPNGHHIMRFELPPGVHLNASLPYYFPSIDVICNPLDPLCNTAAPHQTLYPFISEIICDNSQPDILIIDFGAALETCDCGTSTQSYQFLDIFGNHVDIEIPLYFDNCTPESSFDYTNNTHIPSCVNFTPLQYMNPAGLPVQFHTTVQYICDDNCSDDCAIGIGCGENFMTYHCSGFCDGYFDIENSVLFTRDNFGFVNNAPASLYFDPGSSPVTISPIINEDKAYPGDRIRIEAHGSFTLTPPTLSAVSPSEILQMFFKASYIDFTGFNLPIFDILNPMSTITITNENTLVSTTLSNVSLQILPDPLIPGNTAMYFIIDNVDLVNFLTANYTNGDTYTIDAEIYVIARYENGPPIYTQGWHNLFFTCQFGAEIDNGTPTPDEVGSCDPYNAELAILQPAFAPIIIAEPSTCDEYILDCRLEVPQAFLAFNDFTSEFRNYTHLWPDVTITIPPGYQYLSSEFVIYESTFDITGENNFESPFTTPAQLVSFTLNPTVGPSTLNFTGVGGAFPPSWPLEDEKICQGNVNPMYSIRVHLQPECGAPDGDVTFGGTYTINNSSPDPLYKITEDFVIQSALSHLDPILQIVPPTVVNVTSNLVSFDFTICNTGTTVANNSWISIENVLNSFPIDISTIVVTDNFNGMGTQLPTINYTDLNGQDALLVNTGVIPATGCYNFSLTAELTQTAPCLTDVEQFIVLAIGNQCIGTFDDLLEPDPACTIQTDVHFNFIIQPSELILAADVNGIPSTPVDNCGGTLDYQFVINSTQLGTVFDPQFSINLPDGVSVTNISFEYLGNGVIFSPTLLPTPPTGPGLFSWDIYNNGSNSGIQFLTDNGLTGIQTFPNNNQILVSITLMFECYDFQNDQIIFSANGNSLCNEPVLSNLINHQPLITNAQFHDDLTVTYDFVTSNQSTGLNCSNTGTITITVTNNGGTTNYNNMLSIILSQFPPVNITGLNGGSANILNGTYEWLLPQLQSGDEFVTTFTVALPSPVPFICPGNITITPQLGFTSSYLCGSNECENNYNYSVPPLNIFACCTCEVTTSATAVTCSGGSDGTATASHDGVAPFIYNWSNGDNTQTVTGLSAGTYSVTITDGSGCEAVGSIIVSEPAQIDISFTSDNITCNGDNDGSATANVTGGTAPYTYTWSNTATTQNITNLSPGTYTVTIEDSHNCTQSASVIITEPNVLTATISATVACFGTCNGTATVSASGGTVAYSYLWDNPAPAQTTATATALCAGTYNVTVTDANGCTSIESITINENTIVTATVTGNDVSCNGLCDGDATVAPSGGTGAGTYTFLWNDPLAQTTQTATGLCAGTYNVTVTDGAGCTATDNITINENTALTATVIGNDVSCNGLCDGDATVTVSGGTGTYTYLWDNPAPAQTTATVVGLCAGTFNVTVTDGNGCTVSGIFNIGVQTIPSFTVQSVPDCYYVGGSVAFETFSSYSNVEWNFGDGSSTATGATATHSFNDYGYFCITATDNVCGTYSADVQVHILPDECACGILIQNGGTSNFEYNYDDNFPPITGTFNMPQIPGTASETVEGDIIVENGATLLITSMALRFGPKGRIIVHPGGKLIIRNSLLSNLPDPCHEFMWQGIEVWGVPDEPSNTPNVHGIVEIWDSQIEYAHIAILSGARNDDAVCNYTYPYISNPYINFNVNRAGGIIQTYGVNTYNATFINNGVDIQYLPKQVVGHDASDNIIIKSLFNGKKSSGVITLFDDHYNTATPNSYPSSLNPWAAPANSYQVSNSGIIMDNLKGIDIIKCDFRVKWHGIQSKTAQFNISYSDFLNTRYGIRIDEYTTGINFTHTIDNCIFTDIAGVVNLPGFAININSGINDRIEDCLFDNTTGDINRYQYAIKMSGTTGFNIVENTFTEIQTAIIFRQGINGWIGARTPNWFGNRFTNCQRGIITQFDNSSVALKCNQDFHTGVTSYDYTWDNNGNLANQGQAGSNANDPAGNQFLDPSNKDIKTPASNVYQYHHHNDIDYTPTTSTSVDIVLPFVPNAPLGTAQERCQVSFPVPIVMPVLSFDVYPYSQIGELNNQKDDLINNLNDINDNIDKGQTSILLNEIVNGTGQWNLRNMLIANSPLSDTVLITLMQEDALFPWFYFQVMVRNLPVSRDVSALFYDYNNNNLPWLLRRILKRLQGYNPFAETPAAIEREIGNLETKYSKLLNDIVTTLVDTNNNRLSDAIQVLEYDGSPISKRQLFGTYLNEGDYAMALQKLNELQGIDIENDNFVALNQIVLSLYQQNKTIYEIDSTGFAFVYNLAFECPPYQAVYNAREIVYITTGEEIAECPIDEGNKSMQIFNNDNEFNEYNEDQIYPDISLGHNYPEPFNQFTTIPYELPQETVGQIIIKDILGKTVKVIDIEEGENKIKLNTKEWRSGVYIYTMEVEGLKLFSRKMVLSR